MTASLPHLSELHASNGMLIRLGSRIAQGGEGSVYSVDQSPDWVAKTYHELPDIRQQRKLRLMSGLAGETLMRACAWPLLTLRLQPRGNVIGFLTHRVHHGVPLHMLYDARSRARHFPAADWRFMVRAARSLAEAVRVVHDAGVVIGDLSPSNVLVTRDGTVRLIDCDSYQVQDGRDVYPCTVATPEFTAPELRGRKLAETIRTREGDNFALAALVFHLLFLGRHPFAGRNEKDDHTAAEAILKGKFAFATRDRAVLTKIGEVGLLESDLPASVRRHFGRAFARPGVLSIGTRPAARDWHDALAGLEQEMVTCASDAAHVYARSAGSCPWCRAERSQIFLFGTPERRMASRVAGVATSIATCKAIEHEIRTAAARAQEEAPAHAHGTDRGAKLLRANLQIGNAFITRHFPSRRIHAQEIELAKYVARQEFEHSAQFPDAQACLGDFQRKLFAWESATDSLLTTAMRRGGARAQHQRLAKFAMVAGCVPGLDDAACAALHAQGITSAADLSPAALDRIERSHPAVASSLYFWRLALDRLACVAEFGPLEPPEALKRIRLLERELVMETGRLTRTWPDAVARLDRARRKLHALCGGLDVPAAGRSLHTRAAPAVKA